MNAAASPADTLSFIDNPMPIPIPATILTGFLGAGKTTLLNHLLTISPDLRIAIVENEFGAVGVDGALLGENPARGRVEVVELTNGCVCCSVRGELTAALQDLLKRRDAGQLIFDHLILETTGVADPAPIIQTFFIDETLRERFQLDAVITLVDCEHAMQQLDEHRVAVTQAGFADRLLLSKVDRIDESRKNRLIERLHQINARATLLEVRHGRLTQEAWIGIRAFNLDDTIRLDEPPVHRHSWNDDIASHVFKAEEMDIDRIGAFMESAIEQYGNDMLRYKGVLAIAGEPRRLIVQGVHRVVGFDYGSEWAGNEKRRSVLVVIGRRLPVEKLRETFDQARASHETTTSVQ